MSTIKNDLEMVKASEDILKVDNRKSRNFYTIYFRFGSRFVSLFFVLLLAIPCTIIVFITSIFIKIDSKGGALYSQERTGLNGKNFKIYKLRSMVIDAEKETGVISTGKNDNRITRVGKVIRRYRIDELPQLFNVLNGTMNLVGPRPERPELIEKYSVSIPRFKERLLVKPGITGLAQVNGGYDISNEEKLLFDLKYIESYGLIQDIKIIIKTVVVVFNGEGSR